MAKHPKDEDYSDKEAQARFEAALCGGLSTPHKPPKGRPKPKKLASKRTPPKRG
jgi:hypothetical protein